MNISSQHSRTYTAIGHLSCDLNETGCQLGGTVSFAVRVADLFQYQTAILTSASAEYPIASSLPKTAVRRIISPNTTTFINQYNGNQRRQLLTQIAYPIAAHQWPLDWSFPNILHLAPIAQEINPNLLPIFPADQFIGLTPQGFLRQWDEEGVVSSTNWSTAEQFLTRATATVLSIEDLPNKTVIPQYAQWSDILLLSRGSAGATLYYNGEKTDLPAPKISSNQLETTGAGDILAAAFFCSLYQNRKNPVKSAEFAIKIASQSVTQNNLSAKIEQIRNYILK